MENGNRKQALLRALRKGGFVYCGPGSDELNGRCCKWVLQSIADGLRADRFSAGMKAGALVLGADMYSQRAVRRALAALVEAGLVRRERAPAGRGTKSEAPAKNYLSAKLIELAIEWAGAWRSTSSKPEPCLFPVPAAFHPHPPAEQALARVPAGMRANLALVSVPNLHTDLDTPPLQGGVSLPLLPSPPPARGGGCGRDLN